MAWFYNSHTAKLVHEDPPAPGYYVYEALLHTGTGWHLLNINGDAPESQAIAEAEKEYPKNPKPNSQNNLTGLKKEATGVTEAAASNALPSFGLSVSGIAGWFTRALKVVFGGVLIILGISRLTGADNKIVQLATRVPVPL